MKSFVVNILLCLSGLIAFSTSVNMFALPNEILQGGLIGAAMAVNRFVPGFDVGLAVLLLNIPLFVLAVIFLNKAFALKTACVTVLFSVMLDLGAYFTVPYTDNRLLACIFGGVLSGVGMGLIFLSGATTGGVDIIAMIIRKYFPDASMGRLLLLMDFAVVILSFAAYGDIESVMYTLVCVFLTSKAIDTVMSGREYRKLVLIITDEAEVLSSEISEHIGRGVTMLDAVGAYSRKGKKLLMCGCSVSQSRALARLIKKYDKGAFTVMMNVSDIIGEGFHR